MDLAIVVINWNTRELLTRCLRSVRTALDAGAPLTAASSPTHQAPDAVSTRTKRGNAAGAPLTAASSPTHQTPDAVSTRTKRGNAAGAPFAWQIVVVDSASSDGSAEMVQHEFPEVTVQVLAENRGFGAAANVGLRMQTFPLPPGNRGVGRSSPSAILLLNADTEVLGTAIQEMVTYLETHPDVGVVGPQLCYPDGQVQPSRRRFPTPATLFWESTVLEQYMPGNRWARRYHVADRPDDIAQEVDWLVGACLLVRGEAIAQAGLFDEGFFLYFEELEWCRRIRQAGWRVVYLPAARVIHHEGRSTEQVPLQRLLHFGRSKVRYAREAFGPRWAGLLRRFLLATFAWQWLVEAGKWLLGHRRGLRRERMRIYAAVLKDGLGENARSDK
jgi:N-acetylglucosaminyl-diphospho-decaprenol L-rhamnosyltransferase